MQVALEATFAPESTVTFCERPACVSREHAFTLGQSFMPAVNLSPQSVLLNAFSKTLQLSFLCLSATSCTVLQSLRTRFRHQEESRPQSEARLGAQPETPRSTVSWPPMAPGGGRGPPSPRTCLLPGQGSGLRFLASGQMENAFNFQFPNPQGGASTLQGLDFGLEAPG